MKKLSLILCLMLCGFFVVGGATASAAGKKPMDRDKAITSLYNSFQYDREELGKYYDSGISYLELKKMCLYAYAAKKPLAEVASLRQERGRAVGDENASAKMGRHLRAAWLATRCLHEIKLNINGKA